MSTRDNQPCMTRREGVLTGAASAAEAAGLLATGDTEGAVAALMKAAQAAEDAGHYDNMERLIRLAEKAAKTSVVAASRPSVTAMSSPMELPVVPMTSVLTQCSSEETMFPLQSPEQRDLEGTLPVEAQRPEQKIVKRTPSPPNVPPPPAKNELYLQPHGPIQKNEKRDDDTMSALRLVEVEKEWLEARVLELEQRLKAQEMLDTMELEAKLSGQDSREAQVLDALQSEIESLRAEQEFRMTEVTSAAEQREEKLSKNIEDLEKTLETEVLNTGKSKKEIEKYKQSQQDLLNQLDDLRRQASTMQPPSTAQSSDDADIIAAADVPGREKKHISPRLLLKEQVPPLQLTEARSNDSSPIGSPKTEGKRQSYPPTSPTVSEYEAVQCSEKEHRGVFKGAGVTFEEPFSDEDVIKRDGRLLVDHTVHGSMDRVINVLIDSKHAEVYHDKHGEYTKQGSVKGKCKYTPWKKSNGRHVGYRLLDCITVVQAPWAQHTLFKEHQRYIVSAGERRVKGLTLQISSMTPNVTMGDSFRCEILVKVTELSPDTCKIAVHGYVHFMKTLFGLKGKISSTAYGELKSSFKNYVKLAQEMIGDADKGTTRLSSGPSSPMSQSDAPSAPADTVGPPAAASVGQCKKAASSQSIYVTMVVFVVVSLYLCSVCNTVIAATSESVEGVKYTTELITCALGRDVVNFPCNSTTAIHQLQSQTHLTVLRPLQKQLSILIANLQEATTAAGFLFFLLIGYLLNGHIVFGKTY